MGPEMEQGCRLGSMIRQSAGSAGLLGRLLGRLLSQAGPQAMLHTWARSLGGLPAWAELQDVLWNLTSGRAIA